MPFLPAVTSVFFGFPLARDWPCKHVYLLGDSVAVFVSNFLGYYVEEMLSFGQSVRVTPALIVKLAHCVTAQCSCSVLFNSLRFPRPPISLLPPFEQPYQHIHCPAYFKIYFLVSGMSENTHAYLKYTFQTYV